MSEDAHNSDREGEYLDWAKLLHEMVTGWHPPTQAEMEIAYLEDMWALPTKEACDGEEPMQ